MKAAIAAIPFEHPKLAVVAKVGQQDIAEALEKAMRKTAKVIEARPAPTYETRGDHGSKAEVAEELPDHSKPFPVDNKSRFRRI